jgi:hypothetical protein
MPFPALQDALYGVFIMLEYQDSGHWRLRSLPPTALRPETMDGQGHRLTLQSLDVLNSVIQVCQCCGCDRFIPRI